MLRARLMCCFIFETYLTYLLPHDWLSHLWLQAPNGPLGNLWVLVLLGCLFESSLSLYDLTANNTLRQGFFLLLFLGLPWSCLKNIGHIHNSKTIYPPQWNCWAITMWTRECNATNRCRRYARNTRIRIWMNADDCMIVYDCIAHH